MLKDIFVATYLSLTSLIFSFGNWFYDNGVPGLAVEVVFMCHVLKICCMLHGKLKFVLV